MPSVQELSSPQYDGYLTKHGGSGIKSSWRRRWFVLHNNVLYYFASPTAVKEKGNIPLSVYKRIEDFKQKKFAFQLSCDDPKSRAYNIYADSEDEKNKWIDAIKESISPAVQQNALVGRPASKSVSKRDIQQKKICTLFINISEARKLPATDVNGKSDPYMIADAANCQVKTRTIYKTTDPFWGEDFHVEIADTYATDPAATIKFTVWDEDKFTKDQLIGHVCLPVRSLADGKLHEQWYPIFPDSYKVYVSGDIHLHITKTSQHVTVRVLEGRHLASKDANGLSDPYVRVQYGSEKYRKTHVIRKTLNPFFNEEFIFNREKDYETVHIACYDWDRVGSNEFMGEAHISLDDLEADVINDMWYVLMPMADTSRRERAMSEIPAPNQHAESPLGEVRIKLKYTEDIALPPTSYSSLMKLLTGPNGGKLSLILEGILGAAERGQFSADLVHAAESYSSVIPLLISVTKTEINATIHAETIFRGNSLATKGVDAYMKLTASQYLETVLGPTIKNIYDSKSSCEMDPTREKEENIPKNFEKLQKYANSLIDAIFSSAPICPPALRYLFYNLQQEVQHKYPDNQQARYAVVSSFIFLRHICPAILNPKLFSIVPDHPDQKTARTLTLLSKTIQNLANIVEFGQKEPYMIKMNEFIKANIDNMKKFLNEIANCPKVEIKQAQEPPSADIVRPGAALMRYIDRAGDDLEKKAGSPDSPSEDKQLIRTVLSELDRMQKDVI